MALHHDGVGPGACRHYTRGDRGRRQHVESAVRAVDRLDRELVRVCGTARPLSLRARRVAGRARGGPRGHDTPGIRVRGGIRRVHLPLSLLRSPARRWLPRVQPAFYRIPAPARSRYRRLPLARALHVELGPAAGSHLDNGNSSGLPAAARRFPCRSRPGVGMGGSPGRAPGLPGGCRDRPLGDAAAV